MRTICKILKEIYKILAYIFFIFIKKIYDFVTDENDWVKILIFSVLGFILGFRQLLIEWWTRKSYLAKLDVFISFVLIFPIVLQLWECITVNW